MGCVESAEIIAKKPFVVFAGTGVEQGTGVPDWISLLKAMMKEIELFNKMSEEEHDKYIENKGLENVAQEIYDYYKGINNIKGYNESVKNKIKPTNTSWSAQQMDIIDTTPWVITTNFGTTFENAIRRKNEGTQAKLKIKTKTLPDFKIEKLGKIYTIIYLHGRTSEEYIIFKKDDYEKYYPSISKQEKASKNLEEYLKYIYKYYSIVFIGFSFEDKYIREYLKYICNEIRISDAVNMEKKGYTPEIDNTKHYAFIKKPMFDNENYLIENLNRLIPEKTEDGERARKIKKYNDLLNDLSKMNIEPIILENHIEWTECFEHIRKLRPKRVTRAKRKADRGGV